MDVERLHIRKMIETMMQARILNRKAHGHHRPGKNFFILLEIQHLNNGQPVMPSALASKLDVSQAAISQMINLQVKGGFVRRVHDSHDRRLVLVELTPAGKQRVIDSMKHFEAYIDQLVDYMGVEETREFIRLLNKVFEFSEDYMKRTDERNCL